MDKIEIKKIMEVNSYTMRTLLMYYYRFKRQFPCVGEVKTDAWELADVLVMTKKHMIEIEIKTSKQDLIKGEAKKSKHSKPDDKRIINKYFICVPTELVQEAEKWILNTNPKYGLIEIKTNVTSKDFFKYEDAVHFYRNAQVLQSKYYEILKEKLIKRLSSALVNEYIDKTK